MRIISQLGHWVRERWLEAILFLGFCALVVWLGSIGYGFIPWPPTPTPSRVPPVGQFDGNTAYQHVLAQVNLGPRPTGSVANLKTGEYILAQLKATGWETEVQVFTYQGTQGRNIIGKAGRGPVGIVGAHYDTRRRADADADPARRTEPVLGANDGASGVAVLLELARSIRKERLTNEVWLTFFDAEDNGGLDGWEFAVGSQVMASRLTVTPEFVIVVDMVGDRDQQIYKERTSTPALQDRLWQLAASLGYGNYFLPEIKHSILDDHTAFLRRGIPATDIIDFDYPYWHTTHDTADKVAATSLERVGRVVQLFLETKP